MHRRVSLNLVKPVFSRKVLVLILLIIMIFSIMYSLDIIDTMKGVVKINIDLKYSRDFYGIISVYMNSPKKVYSYSYPFSRNKIIVANFRKAVDDWIEYYRSINVSSMEELVLPTITIHFTLFDEEGYEYYGVVAIGPITYYLLKGLKLRDAIKQVFSNPIKPFIEGIEITITNASFIRIDLDRILDHIFNESQLTNSSSLDKTVLTTIQALDYFEEVYWQDLYDKRYEPPSGWIERITGASIEQKSSMWYIFATKYSKKYYFARDKYTIQQVINAMSNNLFVGLHDMDDFINWLARKTEATASWNDVIEEGSYIFMKVPLAGVSVDYSSPMPFAFELGVVGIGSLFYYQGLALYGLTSIVNEELTVKTIVKTTNVYSSEGSKKSYIVTPIFYQYIGDYVLIGITILSTTINGREYWVVTPHTVFFPYYMKLYSSLSDSRIYKVGIHDPDPHHFLELTWSSTIVEIYDKQVGNNYPTTPGEDPNTFFKDDNQHHSIHYTYYAAHTLSLYKPYVEQLLSSIFLPASTYSRIISTMTNYIKLSLSYTEYSLNQSAYYVYLKGDRTSTLENKVSVTITKMTLQVDPVKAIPLMIRYQVIVG